MQTKKIKIIKVPLEGRKKLAERYGCCRETIFNALAFRSHSKQSEDIRQDALNDFGGVKTEKVVFYQEGGEYETYSKGKRYQKGTSRQLY